MLFPCRCQTVRWSIVNNLWWRIVPGETVRVKWPVTSNGADPNAIYRPWLEENVGRFGYDWWWGLQGKDASENMLSIKVRRSKASWASVIGLMWA